MDAGSLTAEEGVLLRLLLPEYEEAVSSMEFPMCSDPRGMIEVIFDKWEINLFFWDTERVGSFSTKWHISSRHFEKPALKPLSTLSGEDSNSNRNKKYNV